MTFSYEHMDAREKDILANQGFDSIELPLLRRINAEDNQYFIYSNETEYTVVKADTVAQALAATPETKPFKVEHAYCRLPDVAQKSDLEFFDSHNGLDLPAETGVEMAAEGTLPPTTPDAPATSEQAVH